MTSKHTEDTGCPYVTRTPGIFRPYTTRTPGILIQKGADVPRLTSISSLVLLTSAVLIGQATPPPAEYRIYTGSTHAHTSYTWSHGQHLATNDCRGILTYGAASPSDAPSWSDGYVRADGGCPAIFVINGSQLHAPGVTVKPDWTNFQGPPSVHFAAAKAAGYNFYSATDHSQEAGYQPTGPDNAQWMRLKQQAAAATDGAFVGLAGFEHSENDGPGGTGHINVFNSAGMLNALDAGIDLPHLYSWLARAEPNGDGPVVASFNHPGPAQYGNWAGADSPAVNVITMLEVINSNSRIHYPGFVSALDRGWKVSPVAGNDNHGLAGINGQRSRTFVLATALNKTAVLDAMQNRRTYASLDGDLQCRYTVNDAIMGSTLEAPARFQFDITVTNPDRADPNGRITKIDIVKDGGQVVLTHSPDPEHSVRWTPTVEDSTSRYFFVRVWTAGGGDAPDPNPAEPTAWLAPVWTGR